MKNGVFSNVEDNSIGLLDDFVCSVCEYVVGNASFMFYSYGVYKFSLEFCVSREK